jgi:hypothetical protein
VGFSPADRTRLSRLISPQNGVLRTPYGHRSFAAPLLIILREKLVNHFSGKKSAKVLQLFLIQL